MDNRPTSSVSSILDLYAPTVDRERLVEPVQEEEDQREDMMEQLNGGSNVNAHEMDIKAQQAHGFGLAPPLDLVGGPTLSLSEPDASSHRVPTSNARTPRSEELNTFPTSAAPAPAPAPAPPPPDFLDPNVQTHRYPSSTKSAAQQPRSRVESGQTFDGSVAPSFTSAQQPGEEDDAYHIRSTCRRSLFLCFQPLVQALTSSSSSNDRRPPRSSRCLWGRVVRRDRTDSRTCHGQTTSL